MIEILFYFMAITAHLTEIDGITNDKEIRCLYSFFPNFLNVKKKVHNLFQDAVKHRLDLDFSAAKILQMSNRHSDLLKDICLKLIEIADSDGPINMLEFNFISHITQIFGFTNKELDHWIKNFITAPHKITYYEILGVDEGANIKDINNAYRELAMRYHPDKIFAYRDIYPVALQSYKQRYETISNAYQHLKN